MQRSKHARSVTVCVFPFLSNFWVSPKSMITGCRSIVTLRFFGCIYQRCLGAWDYTQQKSSALAQITFSKQRMLDTDLALSTCTCIAVAQNLHVVIGMASTSSCTLCALANIRLRKLLPANLLINAVRQPLMLIIRCTDGLSASASHLP